MRARLAPLRPDERRGAAYAEARRIADEDVSTCAAIGEHGAMLIRDAWNHAWANASPSTC